MLSPSVDVQELLTQAYNEVLRLDSYSTTTGNLLIGQLPEDPPWLADVRSRVAMLAQAGASWTADKPNVWGSVLLQFTDYASSFASVADMQQAGTLKAAADWSAVLDQLLVPQLQKAISATNDAEAALRTHLAAFAAVQPLLEQSIDAGWADLADEEQQMVAIATQLTKLQDLVTSLQDEISSEQISTGKDVISTTVKMLYNVATETAQSFSFLSMAMAVYTVGKSYYDLVTETDEVTQTLQQIGTLQLQASDAAQAAAGTKMVLQLLYGLQESFGTIVDVLPQIATMWSDQLATLQSVVEALSSGVDPSSYLEIVTVPSANAAWQSINQFALAIPQLTTQAGQPVVLDPQNPIPATTTSTQGGTS